MQQVVDIFKFPKYSKILEHYRESSPKSGNKLSYQQMATSLGVSSPRLISMLSRGQRLPSQKMIESTANWLNLSPLEKRYLDLIVQKEQLSNKKEDLTDITAQINELIPINPNMKTLNQEELSFFGRWYVYTIKQLCASKSFSLSSHSIFHLLRQKVSRSDIKKTLSKLTELEFIKKDESERYHYHKDIILKSSNDVRSSDIRAHHQDMLSLAIEALKEQDITQREFQALTFRMDPENISDLKRELRSFTQYLNNKYTKGNEHTLNTYQLNLNFFEHTDGKRL